MKLSPGMVGAAAGPAVHEVDARWLMAYAAALGDTAPEYLDTTRPAGIVGHPLFPVCYEWPLALDLRARTLTDEVAVRGVHATHDLRIHRRARSGDRLSTRAVVVSVEPTPPGALVVTRFTTVDADGQPVSTTDYGSIYRGVECAGAASGGARPRPAPSAAPAEGTPPPAWTAEVSVPATLAHVYTECARIWNPIHTDRAIARGAGLPDTILHGTAALALAVSAVVARRPRGPATAVARIECRFRAMVPLPSVLTVHGWEPAPGPDGPCIAFRAVGPEGGAAVERGRLHIAADAEGA